MIKYNLWEKYGVERNCWAYQPDPRIFFNEFVYCAYEVRTYLGIVLQFSKYGWGFGPTIDKSDQLLLKHVLNKNDIA